MQRTDFRQWTLLLLHWFTLNLIVLRADNTVFLGFVLFLILGDFVGSRLFNEKRWFVVRMI
jgi:hypothetical protein